jgi:hypothetical protein
MASIIAPSISLLPMLSLSRSRSRAQRRKSICAAPLLQYAQQVSDLIASPRTGLTVRRDKQALIHEARGRAHISQRKGLGSCAIWLVLDSIMCRVGHAEKYVLMGGWAEINSIRYETRVYQL